ncbi:Polyketide cyclase / dehydrase and lipid transport [Paramicrobacterium humi]|uniref:Polyketide cyclase / dehydrase and lipid transport n=1 Tax=Paramicrobacterium humi TaxID=640635 RepID=A0A1H4JEQ3_9MICO|nr:SRPBCC family protein [Microbacterium humi]SEB44042.1 Polyketide cyclase / dehydrase and lipid transport [Microbacterium humi]
MSTIQDTEQVGVPLTVAYNQWTQFESFPQFMSNVDSVTQVDDTHNHWKVTIGGVEREFDTVITEQIPDERIAWRTTEGPEHGGVVTFFRVADDETRVHLEMTWEPEGFTEKAGAALQLDDMAVKKDLGKFKELIESNGFETGAWRGEVDRDADATGR